MPLHTVLSYHTRTKHQPYQYARSAGYLDWDTQPNPFRFFDQAPHVSLDLIDDAGPRYEAAFVRGRVPHASLDRRFLSCLFQDALGLSAWKEVEDVRWSLRVNPSSGNLHPTEGYLIAPSIPGLSDVAAIWHYNPFLHALEQRRVLSEAEVKLLFADLPVGAILVGLTSIAWRESWKYGERAFRYCQHDVGHAIGTVTLAAAGLGWQARLLEALTEAEVGALLGTASQRGPEAEFPECLLAVWPGETPMLPDQERHLRLPRSLYEALAHGWIGIPRTLSPDHQDWPIIEVVEAATRKTSRPPPGFWSPAPPPPLLEAGDAPIHLRRIIRDRRSAVSMDGHTGLHAEDFYAMLARCLPAQGRAPFDVLPWPVSVHLALFVNRVAGVEPGLYLLLRDPTAEPLLRAALDPTFEWVHPEACPLPLWRLRAADVRGTAASIACGQSIAADGVFAVGMLAHYQPRLEEFGPWFYRRLHWETGLIGQVLYLEAGACGVQATGIGCFFDDEMHNLLKLRGSELQTLYHFTVGQGIEDTRLRTLAPYAHLQPGTPLRR